MATEATSMRLHLILSAVLTCTLPPLAAQSGGIAKGDVVFTHQREFANDGVESPIRTELYPFYHGVASGDPLSDRVIIWTRVTPDSLNGENVTVTWTMATDPGLADVVRQGEFTTGPERDYTVKVDVMGLASGETYYYGFRALGRNSLTGKTKTTPVAAASDHLRFGVASCSNYQAGYFNAYGRLADRNDLDAVIHLGDYIYEYGNRVYGDSALFEARQQLPDREIVSLFDYRARYSTYRLDTNLMRMHQQHPIIAVWDDHESANDSYTDGAQNHQPATEGDWESRKARSRQVYFEWMPIRDDGDDNIYRTISYGDLADLIMLDTRLEGRDAQLSDITDPALDDPDRTILGTEQRNWFFDRLSASTARYKVIGQQVIFSPFNIGWAGAAIEESFAATESIFLDIWDGYPAERKRVIDFIRDNEIKNVVILTGDFHSTFGFEVTDEPNELNFQYLPSGDSLPVYRPSAAYDPGAGAGAVGVEFATPSITSANFDENVGPLATAFQAQLNTPILAGGLDLGNPNPHMKYTDLIQHGYFILNLRPDSVSADWFFSDVRDPAAPEAFGSGLTSAVDTAFLQLRSAPAAAKTEQDTPAPRNPPGLSTSVAGPDAPVLLSLYPNPTRGGVDVHYGLRVADRVSITLTDAAGRFLRRLRDEHQPAGLYTARVYLGDLPSGTYYLRLITSTGSATQPILKR